MRDPLDASKELLAHAYSQGTAYTNVVIGAGYAGFFATWAFTKDLLGPRQTLWAALLMIISVSVFVLFEVAKTFYLSKCHLALSEAVSTPDNYAALIEKYEQDTRSLTIAFGRFWLIHFGTAVITGVLAAAILVHAILVSLFATYS